MIPEPQEDKNTYKDDALEEVINLQSNYGIYDISYGTVIATRAQVYATLYVAELLEELISSLRQSNIIL